MPGRYETVNRGKVQETRRFLPAKLEGAANSPWNGRLSDPGTLSVQKLVSRAAINNQLLLRFYQRELEGAV